MLSLGNLKKNHTLTTGTTNRKSPAKMLKTSSTATTDTTFALVEGVRPRDDAVPKFSDSQLAEVEITFGEYLGRESGKWRTARRRWGGWHSGDPPHYSTLDLAAR